MASKMSGNKKPEYGIIITGNAGSGKSYLCNLLMGKNRFESKFQSTGVTTKTEHERIDNDTWELLLYNIPGLIEVDQTAIDRNKKEIMRAFTECPNSIVIFVWTQVGGRVQSDDVIAFKALNEAYHFVPKSLAFVVNNLPPNRPQEYEGQFLATLEYALKPLTTVAEAIKDIIFIDTMQDTEYEKMKKAGLKLSHLMMQRTATKHQKHAEIRIQADQLNEEREKVKATKLELERNRAVYAQETARWQDRYDTMQKQYEVAEGKLSQVLDKAKKDAERDVRLDCGGRACSICGKCTASSCKVLTAGHGAGIVNGVGAIVRKVGYFRSAAALLTIPLGSGIGVDLGAVMDAAVRNEHKCKC